MSLAAELQPDQNPELWNNHVTVYEEVFEPLTNAFATQALDRLNVAPGDRLIDIGAVAGGAPRNREPDAARSAGDEEGLAFERHQRHRLRAKNASKATFASGDFRRSLKILAS